MVRSRRLLPWFAGILLVAGAGAAALELLGGQPPPEPRGHGSSLRLGTPQADTDRAETADETPVPRFPAADTRSTPDLLDPRPEPDTGRPLPQREREYREEFLRQGRLDPAALAVRARQVLLGPGPDAEKVAVLQAVWSLRLPAAAELFQQSLRSEPGSTRPGGDPLRAFLVGLLGKECAREPLARTVLAAVAADPLVLLAHRRRAVAWVAATAPADELRELARRLAAEPDAGLVEEAVRAAAGNPDQASAQQFLWTLGRQGSGR